MSKKQEFVNYIKNVLDYLEETKAPITPMEKDALLYWNALLETNIDGEKVEFTDNGKAILQFLQNNTSTEMWKARDIAEGLFKPSRSIAGACRKLVTDGYLEKMGENPAVYTITEKGKKVIF